MSRGSFTPAPCNGCSLCDAFEAEYSFVDWFLDVVCAFDIKVIHHVISFTAFVADGSGLVAVLMSQEEQALTRWF
jgi:hypothetical protein